MPEDQELIDLREFWERMHQMRFDKAALEWLWKHSESKDDVKDTMQFFRLLQRLKMRRKEARGNE